MKKAKAIDRNKYLKLAKTLETSDQFKIARNALAYNSISKLCYDQNKRQAQPFVFSNDIVPKTLTITNQNQSGRCWLFSTLNMIRVEIIKKWKVSNFEFSESYLAMWDKYERANKFLEDIIASKDMSLDERTVDDLMTYGISDGGFFEYASSIIQKYGVVPNEIMPDSFNAKSTDLLNKLINRSLKLTASKIRNKNNSDQQIQDLKQSCLQDILKILSRTYGRIPTEFSYTYTSGKQSKTITAKNPLDFYNKFVKFNFKDYVDVITNPSTFMKYNQNYELEDTRSIIESQNVIALNVRMSLLKLLVIATLLDNKPLWFACDVSSHGDREKGIWDFETSNYEQLFDIQLNNNRTELVDCYQTISNHAMSLVGFNIDKQKTLSNQKTLLKKVNKYQKNLDLLIDDLVSSFAIDKWKIENSWGPKYGDKGFFMMTDTWFNQFFSQAIISKSALKKFLTKPSFIDPKLWKQIKGLMTVNNLIEKGLKTKPILYSKYAPLSFKQKGKIE